jgi:hypothetical protein
MSDSAAEISDVHDASVAEYERRRHRNVPAAQRVLALIA